jgi:hypothetical protein
MQRFEDGPIHAQTRRVPERNVSTAVQFVVKGSQKRRQMAYQKAKMLQRELGVIPKLVSVK